MIPKKIHYCWFGKNELPKSVKNCIESWKKVLPDYELCIWTEENCDMELNKFVQEAYMQKKYAFVSDFFRLKALYDHGGVYLDTDVEVVRSLNPLLNENAFIGFQEKNILNTGTIGSCKNNDWIRKLIKYYEFRSFILSDGTMDTRPNTDIITKITNDFFSIKLSEGYYSLEGEIKVFPVDYFCANNWITGEKKITENTYTVHHFDASWLDKNKLKKRKRKMVFKNIILKIISEKKFMRIKKFLKRKK